MVSLKMLVVYRKKHTHVLKNFFLGKYFFCFCVAKTFYFNWIPFEITSAFSSVLILYYIHTESGAIAVFGAFLMEKMISRFVDLMELQLNCLINKFDDLEVYLTIFQFFFWTYIAAILCSLSWHKLKNLTISNSFIISNFEFTTVKKIFEFAKIQI